MVYKTKRGELAVNLSVSNSPFNEHQADQLNQVVSILTTEQKVWLSGYLSAYQNTLVSDAEAPQQVAEYVLNSESEDNIDRNITVLYGSETGNAQSLAEIFADRLVEHNYTVKLTAMDEFKPKDLKK